MLLYGSDALSFNEELIRDGDDPQYAPGSAVVAGLVKEQLFAGTDHLVILLVGGHSPVLLMLGCGRFRVIMTHFGIH